jgi:hypothetical protein
MMLAMPRRKHCHHPRTSTFRQRFGRDPRPEDPVFWSERSTDTPVPMSEEEVREVIRNALERAGLPGDDVVSRRILGLD